LCSDIYDLLFGKEPIVEVVAVISAARFIKRVGTRADIFNECKLVLNGVGWLVPYTRIM
jgi:hypothetical protein